ncbi:MULTISPECIES: hypothetical protein [unclassified Raoultella]|uniref:hypothetical protein n=1 Tax=unclassified Raoultella TaxID=2627600 RepID=UPI001D0FDED8|nr:MULTISPECIES: hypothetical protein [unclassified Raoultella]
MTDITELEQKPTRYGTNSQGVFTNQTDGAYVSYLDFVALVEALEKAQQHIARQEQILLNQDESLSIRRGELEAAQQERENWRTSFDNERFRADKLKEHIDEMESSGVAPGILRCTECSFVLTKNIISVTADTITTVESEPEPCPNGCGQLQSVTWKALAIQLMFNTKQGLSDLLEAKKRIEELESDLSEWTDCKHDGATYYDMSGRERCGRCGADI